MVNRLHLFSSLLVQTTQRALQSISHSPIHTYIHTDDTVLGALGPFDLLSGGAMDQTRNFWTNQDYLMTLPRYTHRLNPQPQSPPPQWMSHVL